MERKRRTDQVNHMNEVNEMVKGEIRKKILHYNEQSFNDEASLRYLANKFPGVIFKNDEGLMDLSFEVDDQDLSNEGEVVRIKIKKYQNNRFIGAVSTLREVEDYDHLGTFEDTEVSDDLGDISEWIEEKIDSETYQDIEELPEVNISEVEA